MKIPRLKPITIIIPAAIALILMAILFSRCGNAKKTPIATLVVKKDSFQISIPARGDLQSVTSTPITAPVSVQDQLTIAWILPENSLVKTGDTVVKFDKDKFLRQIQDIDHTIAKLDQDILKRTGELDKEKTDLLTEIELADVEKKLTERYSAKDEVLYSRNDIIDSAIDVEYAATRSRHYGEKSVQLKRKIVAELQLLRMRRQTEEMKRTQFQDALQSVELKAPHDGLFVYERSWFGQEPRVGASIWPGQKVGQLPDLNSMQARIYVLESEAGGLKKDLPAAITIDSAPGRQFQGRVSAIDTIAKPRERRGSIKYFEVKTSLDITLPTLMKPGSSVSAIIYVENLENVIAVPNQALFFDKGKPFIHISSNGAYEKRPVEIGARSLTRTVIVKGLEPDEEILLGNPPNEEN